ncbi:MAG: magnesium protoporphyrin IX methyltransferase [Chloroflexota bacterium]
MDNATRHKAQLKQYFDTDGFERWSAIYDGQTELSSVRQTVREGHDEMLQYAVQWVLESHTTGTLLDAGCGTGLFSLQMAQRGFNVTGVDIAPRMVASATSSAQYANVHENAHFMVGDVDTTTGTYDIAVCFDVLIHYPHGLFSKMVRHLAQRTKKTLLFTYAPYSNLLATLHWVGGLFPKGQRRTEIKMIPDSDVAELIHSMGMTIKNQHRISRGFYHVTLLEATY